MGANEPRLRPGVGGTGRPGQPRGRCRPSGWTCKSTRRLAAALHERGYWVSDFHPDREAQFTYLNSQVKAHHDDDCPVISVDTKKKQLVRGTAPAGRNGSPEASPPRSTSSTSSTRNGARRSPSSVYDLAANTITSTAA
ncbi:MAG: ISAzo13-like element transposase-related protein [Pseudonocardiaceae bacterium]